MARSIAFEDLATVVYVWVDDGFQAHAAGGRQGQAGAQPRFSDSEVSTRLLLMDFLPFPGETQFLGFVRANHRTLFPQRLSQSQFNRRARQLWPWVEALRRHWAEALGATRASLYLLDTKCWIPSRCPSSATRATSTAATLRPRPTTEFAPAAS